MAITVATMRHPVRPKYLKCRLLLIAVALCGGVPAESRAGSPNADAPGKLAFHATLKESTGNLKANDVYPSRYQRPDFIGKSLPSQNYKGFTLIGSGAVAAKSPDNVSFFSKIRQSIDLIEHNAPKIYALMGDINPRGRRIIAYAGRTGPASFVAWGQDYIVNITAANLDEDPVFENSTYTLSATLVHELLGHGSQQNDGRVWAMYDWCGESGGHVEGVAWQTNVAGHSSGLVEYEANLFARWFLESVRGTYPNLNEVPIRRYVKIVRTMKKRFPGWYSERKTSTALLREFEGHFKKVCPGLPYTPHAVSNE